MLFEYFFAVFVKVYIFRHEICRS